MVKEARVPASLLLAPLASSWLLMRLDLIYEDRKCVCVGMHLLDCLLLQQPHQLRTPPK